MSAELRPFVTETQVAGTRDMESVLGAALHGTLGSITDNKLDSGRKEEKPWHKFAARCFAQGMGTGEVAAVCDVSPNTITTLVRTPWFNELIDLYMKEDAKDVTDRIKAEQFRSVQILCDLRDSEKVSPTVRANICFNFLDRHLGKPTQKVEVAGTVVSGDPVAEAERLEQEVRQLSGATST